MELRSALREHNIVVYSILLPLLLYPALLWLLLSGFSFVQGQTEGIVSRVALVDLPPEQADVRARLTSNAQLEVTDAPGGAASAIEDLREGRVDVVVQFTPAQAGTFTDLPATLTFDGARDRSATAHERVSDELQSLRTERLDREAARLGVTADEWQQFHVVDLDQTSEAETGVYVLRVLLPTLLIVMIALGCFYPAIDATAGERERSTWETTMTLAVSRTSVVTGKYLYVATLGVVAALLNVAAMVASLGPIIKSLTGGRGRGATFAIPLSAIPVILLGAVMVALFIGAAMMIFAAFARTFKEGQTMVSPFYLLTLLPVMFLQTPDLDFTPALALIPVVNVAMMFRDAIGGLYQWPLIAITVGVEVVTIAACLWLARWILRFEEVWMGAFQGTLIKFVRSRTASGARGTGNHD